MGQKLTNAEFDQLYNKALCAFAQATEDEMTADIYRLRKSCSTISADRLWLYVYALNSWDNTPGAVNYLTEDQVLSIISKVQIHGSV